MTKNNKLPKDKKLLVTRMVDTYGGAAGSTMIAHHDANGWHGVDENGQAFYLFAENLRNPDRYKIEVIDK